MSNFSIKVNLLKVKSAFLTNIKGAQETKRCLVIPFDSTDLYEGEKGIYLDLAAFEMREPKHAETHLIKVSLKKEIYEKMTEEERNAQPIIGGMKPFIAAKAEVNTTAEAVAGGEGDDLPF